MLFAGLDPRRMISQCGDATLVSDQQQLVVQLVNSQLIVTFLPLPQSNYRVPLSLSSSIAVSVPGSHQLNDCHLYIKTGLSLTFDTLPFAVKYTWTVPLTSQVSD